MVFQTFELLENKTALENVSYVLECYGSSPRQSDEKVMVEEGQLVEKGVVLTSRPVNPQELLKVKDMETVQKYIIDEVQKVYKSQSVPISDKHIEIISRQMTKRVVVRYPGDSGLPIGYLIERGRIKRLNKKLR
ncbi:hypothetical protein SFC65_20220 [Priestia filamentosa]|uniref:hypothetical protein n=1 Tax=Priestia filamentosa TaxID=1402861 RepID=UPI003982B7D9